jgi:PST family polysaccharide transporter
MMNEASKAAVATAELLSAQAKPARSSSYRDILISSALIGGSSALNICLGILRTKAMAVLLGPTGYGMVGAYVVIAELSRNVAQMGVNASGVRQIADAVASSDSEKVARTATTLRRMSLAFAVLGAVLLVVLSGPVSRLTFGDESHSGDVALLSLAVFSRCWRVSEGALLSRHAADQ